MGKGFTKEESNALDSCVKGVVDRAVDSLMVLGMTKQSAFSLLMHQAAVRFTLSDNNVGLMETMKSIRDGLADADDDEYE